MRSTIRDDRTKKEESNHKQGGISNTHQKRFNRVPKGNQTTSNADSKSAYFFSEIESEVLAV